MSALEGKNHIIQRDESAWRAFSKSLLEFTFSGQTTDFDDLTKREQDVLRLICQAMSGKEIARSLQMSEKTVRNHTSKIYAKLELQNRQHAIRTYGHLF